MERNTRQKSAVREALVVAGRPLTPFEILEGAQALVPGIGIATVYRVLKSMTADGSVVPVELPGSATRYETAHRGHHHHFHCRGCERVYEVAGCPPDLARFAPPGFVLDGHEVVLYGRCSTCAVAGEG
ncbi:MAG: transcriptional repressor [Gemmatimonadetes bacterium]|nr:transcriptional repressor [Gemmatimonadota bacterium]